MRRGWKIAIGAGVLWLLFRNKDFEPKVKFADYRNYPLKNVRNSKAVATLHPYIRDAVYGACLLFDQQGFNYIIAPGYRTWKTQHQLYVDHKTNADAGQSYHNYGLALDIYIVRNRQLEPPNSFIIQTLTNQGFQYGGYWSHPDPPHFQKSPYNWRELLRRLKTGQVDENGYVIL